MSFQFYKRLMRRSRQPLLLLAISAACLVMVFLTFSVFETGAFWGMPFGYLIQTVSIVALFLFMVAFGVLLTIGILFFFVGRPSRKATLERYRMLANSDRMEIEQEAASLQNGTLLYGARRIYFTLQNSNMPCFLSYGEAAWVYLTLNGIPASENPVALSVQIGTNAAVHFYDRSGVHYSASIRGLSHCETREVIDALREHFPNALYGYSKERARTAKGGFPT